MCVMKKGKIARRRFLAFTIIMGILFFIMLPRVSDFLLLTRYRSYVAEGRSRMIGYWYVFASSLAAFLSLYLKKNRDCRTDIGIAVSAFSILLVGAAVYLGAYRLVTYYSLPRYYLWDRILGEMPIRNRKSIVYKGIIFAFIVVFMIYTMGRNSTSKGFAYRLIDF